MARVNIGSFRLLNEKKLKQNALFIAVVPCDTEMYSKSTPVDSRGQCYLVALAKGHLSAVCYHFERHFPLLQVGQFQLNFICSRSGGATLDVNGVHIG